MNGEIYPLPYDPVLGPIILITMFAVLIGGFLLVYFVPTLVAWWLGHPHRAAIFWLNLLVGWTWLAWFLLLAWAVLPAADGTTC
jgi:hypothetical protein